LNNFLVKSIFSSFAEKQRSRATPAAPPEEDYAPEEFDLDQEELNAAELEEESQVMESSPAMEPPEIETGAFQARGRPVQRVMPTNVLLGRGRKGVRKSSSSVSSRKRSFSRLKHQQNIPEVRQMINYVLKLLPAVFDQR